MGCHRLLQGIFLTPRSNSRLLCLIYWQAGSLPPAPPGALPLKCQVSHFSGVPTTLYCLHVSLAVQFPLPSLLITVLLESLLCPDDFLNCIQMSFFLSTVFQALTLALFSSSRFIFLSLPPLGLSHAKLFPDYRRYGVGI